MTYSKAQLIELREKAKLNAAIAALCDQDPEAAIPELGRIDAARLPEPSKRAYAEALALAGRPDDALALVKDDPIKFRATHELIQLVRGKVPEELSNEPGLWARAAAIEIGNGKAKRAFGRAMDAWKKVDAGDLLVVIQCFDTLMQVLTGALWDEFPATEKLSNKDLSAAVLACDKLIKTLTPPSTMPKRLVSHVGQLARRYYSLVHDAAAFQSVSAWAAERDDERDPDLPIALSLAKSGDVQSALRRVASTSEHPWRKHLFTAAVLATAGRLDEAERKLEALVTAFPGRPVLDFELASVRAYQGKDDAGLPYAQKAFEAVPGIGQRLLLSELLVRTNRKQESWSLLSGVPPTKDRRHLWMRALLAEEYEVASATTYWRDYLNSVSNDASIWCRLGGLYYRLAQPLDAAEASWQAFNIDNTDQLSCQQLHSVALIQQASLPGQEGDERTRQVCQRLLSRGAGGDVTADQYYLSLFGALREPGKLPPPDIDALVRTGALAPLSNDEVVRIAAQVHRDQSLQHRLYEAGYTSFETFTDALSMPIALSLQFAKGRRIPFVSGMPRAEENDTLPPKRILMGLLELHSIQELTLLDPLKTYLGEGGRIVLFHDLWERIIVEAVDARGDARSTLNDRLQRLSATLEENGTKTVLVPAEETDLSSFLNSLETDVVWENATRSLPAQVQVSIQTCFELHERGLLEQLLHHFGDRAAVILPTAKYLDNRRERLSFEIAAATKTIALHHSLATGLKQGWVELKSRPADVVPSNDLDPNSTFLVRQMNEALSWLQTIAAEPDIHLCRAESLSNEPFAGGAPEDMIRAAFRGPPMYFETKRKFFNKGVRSRRLQFTKLCLILSAERRAEVVRDLATLGYPAGWEPEDYCDLVLAGSHEAAKNLICSTIRPSPNERHPGNYFARLEIARLVARTIWEIWGRIKDVSLAERCTRDLLDACETSVKRIDSTLIDLCVIFLGYVSFGDVEAAYRKDVLGNAVLDSEGQTARAWRAVANWATNDLERKGALRRSVYVLLKFADRTATDPVRLSVLTIVLGELQRILRSEIDAFLVLSTQWSVRPAPIDGLGFDFVSPEHGSESLRYRQVLELATKAFLQNTAPINLPRSYRYRATLSVDWVGTKHVSLDVPIEALVLGSPPEKTREHAHGLRTFIGLDDGRLYDRLVALEKSPNDKSVQKQFALEAALSPWRQVRSDPLCLLRWQSLLGLPEGVTIEGLSRVNDLLSEPAQWQGTHLLDEFVARFDKDGFWSQRQDAFQLGLDSSGIPGWSASWFVDVALREKRQDSIEDAFALLGKPEDLTSGEVARSLLILRCACESGTPDQRARFVDLLIALLADAESPANTTSIAGFEDLLLLICSRVVGGLAQGERRTERQCTWLTYRLCGWWVRQLYALEPDEVAETFTRLKALREQIIPLTNPRPFIFNPELFGAGRLEHRLAFVLHAMIISGPIANKVSGADEFYPSWMNDTRLKDILVRLASRDETPTETLLLNQDSDVLPWAEPVTVPRLALQALLCVNPKAITQLPETTLAGAVLRLRSDNHADNRLQFLLATAMCTNANNLPASVRDALRYQLENDPNFGRGHGTSVRLFFTFAGYDLESILQNPEVPVLIADETDHGAIFSWELISNAATAGKAESLLPVIEALTKNGALEAHRAFWSKQTGYAEREQLIAGVLNNVHAVGT